ncbi:MAG: cyclic nucleotide-binding domain-containing protein, partial [Planctomycetaceae bacterium]|nr:cyclic nucleotide-binding domain-containing protein [Planctomycetaceae bacterium]
MTWFADPHLDLLRGLTIAQLTFLEGLAERRYFERDHIILAEGASQDRVFLLKSGRVRLEMNVPGRGRTTILTLGPGDLLAFSALIGNSVMTATAVAEEPVEAISFDGVQLRAACDADHELGYRLMSELAETLSRRLVATRLQLLDLFRNSGDTRTQSVSSADNHGPAS